jgi:hypothetical protein
VRDVPGEPRTSIAARKKKHTAKTKKAAKATQVPIGFEEKLWQSGAPKIAANTMS